MTAGPVVVVDVDSLRPDHLGAYGHHLPTSPSIDSLAEDGVVFDRAYAASTPCMPSRAAFLTGRYGVHNGIATHGPDGQQLNDPRGWPCEDRDGVDPREWYTLPEVCYHERIPTVAVSTFPRHLAPWFTRTWHRFEQPQEPPGERETFATPRAGDVVDRALDALPDSGGRDADRSGAGDGDDRFLLYVQLWDPHFPYRREERDTDRFRGAVDNHPHPTDAEIAAHRERDAPLGPDEAGIEDRADLDRTLAAYDAEIRAADRGIARLVESLRDRGLYEDALVVVTADHGEAFGEHGVYRHHWSVHEPTQRIPLVVKPPASTPAVDRVGAPVTNADLAPTILDYLGFDPPARWQGQSLRPVVSGDAERPHDLLVLDHGLQTAQRATLEEKWKLVRTLHPGGWESELPEVALYDLESDPGERTNLAPDRPALVDRLTDRTGEWVRDHRCDRLGDPLAAVTETGPAGHRFRQWWRDRA